MPRLPNPEIDEIVQRLGCSRRTAFRIRKEGGLPPEDEGQADKAPPPVDRIEDGQPSPSETIIEGTEDQPPQPIEGNQIEPTHACGCQTCRSYRGRGWTVCRSGWRQRPERTWCPHHRPTNTEDTEQ